MKETLILILDNVEFAISVISITVVIYGSVRAIIDFIKDEVLYSRNEEVKAHSLMAIRADFGVYLMIALQFLIAADIIRTILKPDLMELATLGGIVLLRTVLSIFLERELKELKEMRSE
ncbi:MAG: DUF1622 domain-containing protein [Treponema sp.]|nr:DUF1622 domain-containing protein [Treponema sp.]